MKGLNLKDIKPIVDVNDSSLYWLIALILVVVAILLVVFFIWYKARRKALRRYKKSIEYHAKEALKNIDFSNTIEAVYSFSKNEQILANSEQKDRLNMRLEKLERYKYKKESIALEKEDIDAIKEFIKEVV
jgi:flagellar biosynthesis/type III secretory pathway M-ring protein FliF/YscJ